MKIFKKFFYQFCFLIFVSLIFFGCKKTEQTLDLQAGEEISKQTSNSGFERTPVIYLLKTVNMALPKLPFSTGAHRKYLEDKLLFQNIPDGGIPRGSTAVVGSDVCYFYPIENISSQEELEKLPAGELIPFATIIPLGQELKSSSNDNYNNYFKFQDNYNYFYKTTWNGKQGIIFGADLYGINDSNESNRIIALLYKENGHFSDFYPITGYDEIRIGIQKELETNGLAFQEVKHKEYHLNIDRPDDMISLYMDLAEERQTPVFVTTDLAAHANHLVFDRMLQHLEEEFFFPQLVNLTDEYIKTIEQKKGQIHEEVYNTSLFYFQTAHALLALAPRKVEVKDGYRPTYEYQDVDAAGVLRNYPLQVIAEIEKMNLAAGFDASSVFDFGSEIALKEDYSQYKVRGHYTKNGILGAYFRALMWYGRINFNLGGGEGEKAFALRLAPVALFITDLTENSDALKKLWQSLFDPITEIIGASDDISFYEMIPLWNKIKGSGFAQWYNDPKNPETFISTEYTELRPPSISGSSLFLGPYSGRPEMENRLPPIGWRLFGQRYTLDSEIHHNVSPPRLIALDASGNTVARDMVRGLDIMKVFGSNTADRFLREEGDYSKMPRLQETLNEMQKNLENLKGDYWLSTYYTNILYQIKTMAVFENGAGFYFTEKPGWNLKAMNCAHGTWAELRHDTILYVKQVYAEKGGDGDWPSFRTKPLPEPVHYIEPNIPFWIVSALGIQKMHEILTKYDYLDERTAKALVGMYNFFKKAVEISMLEVDDQEVPRNDLTWIRYAARELSRLVLSHIDSNSYVDDTNNLRMALVADVFTNAEIGLVLETAVGIPYRLYIPLNDKQGGKRIAVGYGFSYYEFGHPMSNRLNNDEWKAIVYKDNQDMSQYLPFWMRGKVQPAR